MTYFSADEAMKHLRETYAASLRRRGLGECVEKTRLSYADADPTGIVAAYCHKCQLCIHVPVDKDAWLLRENWLPLLTAISSVHKKQKGAL